MPHLPPIMTSVVLSLCLCSCSSYPKESLLYIQSIETLPIIAVYLKFYILHKVPPDAVSQASYFLTDFVSSLVWPISSLCLAHWLLILTCSYLTG